MTLAHVALGSNLGDREAWLVAARAGLEATPGVALIAASQLHETEPVGPPPQGRYLNAAVALETTLDAPALLARLHALELDAGRVRGAEPDLPRTLDLDLLLFGDARCEAPELVLPHPRLHLRAFVLVPLAEVAADVVHPVLRLRIGELATRVSGKEGVRPWPGRRWRAGF